jgi:hypothetical protein
MSELRGMKGHSCLTSDAVRDVTALVFLEYRDSPFGFFSALCNSFHLQYSAAFILSSI